MIDWKKEQAATNNCGYCIDHTCTCNGMCFNENHLNLDYKANRENHIKLELVKVYKRLADLLFDQRDWDSFHDTVHEALNVSLMQEGLEEIFWQLPDNIRDLAFQWGLSDTVFSDDAYTFLKNSEVVMR